MRAYRWLVALVFMAGGLHAQTVGSLASSACPLGGCAQGGTGTVTTTSTLVSGRVALSSGAASLTDDAGCTWTGTGPSFIATFGGGVEISNGGFGAGGWASFWGASNGGVTMGSGNLVGWGSATSHPAYSRTGIDLALSRASAGLLLVEDGSGNARDVQARTGTFGTSVVSPVVDPGGTTLTLKQASGAAQLVLDGVDFLPATDAGTNFGGYGRRFYGLYGYEGRFSLATYSPLYTSGSGKSGTNVGGTNNTIQAEPGTGNATGSSIIFQTPTAGASGTTAQTQATRLTLSEPAVVAAVPVRLAGYTVATLPAGTVGDTAYVTDATAPTYLGALTGGGAVTVPVFYNGAAWVSH